MGWEGTKWILKVFPGIWLPQGGIERLGRNTYSDLCIHFCFMAAADTHNPWRRA